MNRKYIEVIFWSYRGGALLKDEPPSDYNVTIKR